MIDWTRNDVSTIPEWNSCTQIMVQTKTEKHNYQQRRKSLTWFIDRALNVVELQYTIVSSPIIMTPPSGTGTNRRAPLSKFFWDQEPSTNSLSSCAISYVLTCLASLLSWSVIWNKNHWWKNHGWIIYITKMQIKKPKKENALEYVFFFVHRSSLLYSS
jgi:hypothetical protein